MGREKTDGNNTTKHARMRMRHEGIRGEDRTRDLPDRRTRPHDSYISSVVVRG